MAVVGGRLYRFGGHDGESYVGGGIEWLDVSGVWQHAESGTTALQSGWVEEIAYQGVKDLKRGAEPGGCYGAEEKVSLGDQWRGEGAVVVGSVGCGCSGG